MASERTSHLTSIFSQPVGREGEEKGKLDLKRESFKERDSTFSLNFLAIGPAVSSRARGKVHPHGKGFEKRSELGSFDKLREVGLFLLWLLSTLRVVWWLYCSKGNVWLRFEP